MEPPSESESESESESTTESKSVSRQMVKPTPIDLTDPDIFYIRIPHSDDASFPFHRPTFLSLFPQSTISSYLTSDPPEHIIVIDNPEITRGSVAFLATMVRDGYVDSGYLPRDFPRITEELRYLGNYLGIEILRVVAPPRYDIYALYQPPNHNLLLREHIQRDYVGLMSIAFLLDFEDLVAYVYHQISPEQPGVDHDAVLVDAIKYGVALKYWGYLRKLPFTSGGLDYALDWAVRLDDLNIVKLLQAQPQPFPKVNYSPPLMEHHLHTALHRGYRDIVTYIVGKNPELLRNESIIPVLQQTFRAKHYDALRLVLNDPWIIVTLIDHNLRFDLPRVKETKGQAPSIPQVVPLSPIETSTRPLRLRLPKFDVDTEIIVNQDEFVTLFPKSLITSALELDPTTETIDITSDAVTPDILFLIRDMVITQTIPPINRINGANYYEAGRYLGISVLEAIAHWTYDGFHDIYPDINLLFLETLTLKQYRTAYTFASIGRNSPMIDYLLSNTDHVRAERMFIPSDRQLMIVSVIKHDGYYDLWKRVLSSSLGLDRVYISEREYYGLNLDNPPPDHDILDLTMNRQDQPRRRFQLLDWAAYYDNVPIVTDLLAHSKMKPFYLRMAIKFAIMGNAVSVLAELLPRVEITSRQFLNYGNLAFNHPEVFKLILTDARFTEEDLRLIMRDAAEDRNTYSPSAIEVLMKHPRVTQDMINDWIRRQVTNGEADILDTMLNLNKIPYAQAEEFLEIARDRYQRLDEDRHLPHYGYAAYADWEEDDTDLRDMKTVIKVLANYL